MKLPGWIPLLVAGIVAVPSAGFTQVSPESAKKYEEGQELFDKRRFHEALTAFESAAQLDEKNAQAWRAIGRTCKELRSFDKAAESFRKATAVNPGYAAAYFELGQLQFELRKYAEAQDSFAKVMELDPEFEGGKARTALKSACLNQGGAYFRQRNYAGAIQEYQKATNLDPTDATAYYYLGLSHKESRNFNEAVDALGVAIDLDPKHSKAHKLLGDLYRSTRRNSDAIKAYSNALDIDPKLEDAYTNLAVTYLSTEQPSEAVLVLQRAVAHGLEGNRIFNTLGYAYAAQKAWDKAIAAYRKSLTAEPTAEVRYRLAVAFLATRQYDSAIAMASEAAKDSKFRIPANVILGDIYEAMKPAGWKEKAIAHYTVGVGDRQYSKYCEDMIQRIKNPAGEQ